MSVGKNTLDGQRITEFIHEIERIREAKKQLGEDEKANFAAAKAAGYSTVTLRDVLKIRRMKPADRQEAESLLETYLHAIGMDAESPLFRRVGLMSIDKAAKAEVIDAFKLLVPTTGEIIVSMGGAKVRLWRDKDGTAHSADVIDEPKPEPAPVRGEARPKKDAPDCNEAAAKELGRIAAKSNEPVINNPFPWDDARRARWDEGWREGSGSDGMGPDTRPQPDGKKK